ncbi:MULTISPECIES: autotransporter outer membrane beta-barrel domain-containing protein [Dyella]|nr:MULTISPECIES: autotransporter domain-containing protein [Dyella]
MKIPAAKLLCRARADRIRTAHHQPLAIAIGLVLLLGDARMAAAQTAQWTGGVSSDWHEPRNWTIPPGATLGTDIDRSTPNIARIAGNDAIGWLIVGNSGSGELDVTPGGTLQVVGAEPSVGFGMILGVSKSSSGRVALDGAGASLSVNANALIGYAGQGSLSITNGATVELGIASPGSELLVGFGLGGRSGWNGQSDVSGGTGAISVSGANSTLSYGGGLNLLNGTVDVRDGGQLINRARPAEGVGYFDSVIGVAMAADARRGQAELNGQGSVTVSGAGSTWYSDNGLEIGRGGKGVLSILDAGTARFTGNTFLVGSSNGSKVGTGTVLVSGVGSLLEIGSGAVNKTVLVVGQGNNDLLEIAKGGTMTVTGSGTVTGKSSGSGGTVAVHDADSHLQVAGTMTATNGGTLQVADEGQVIVSGGMTLGELGSIVIGNPSGAALTSTPGLLSTPTLVFSAPTSRLAFNHTAGTYDFASAMSGNGTMDVDAGFTRLTADSRLFIGVTTVRNGATLCVDGALGGVINVGQGGTLACSGSVGTVIAAGAIAPGHSPGTLHVDGDLTMQSGSTYEAEIDPGRGLHDSITVGGNVVIEPGATLQVIPIGTAGLTPGTQLQLLQVAGTTSGQFDAVDGSITPFLGYGLTYGNGGILLTVQRNDLTFASFGSNANQRSVGAALDSLPADSALITDLTNQLTNTALVGGALASLAGDFHPSVRTALVEDSYYVRQTVNDHLAGSLNSVNGQSAHGGDTFSTWIGAWGHRGDHDATAQHQQLRASGSGFLVGADMTLGSTLLLGALAGGSRNNIHMNDPSASTDVTATHFGIYGSTSVSAFRFRAAAIYAWERLDSQRTVTIGSLSSEPSGRYHANLAQGYIEASHVTELPRGILEPALSLAQVRVHTDAIHERGSNAALNVDAATSRQTYATLGVRGLAVLGAKGEFALEGSLGWQHAWGDHLPKDTMRFLDGGDAFTVTGMAVAKDAMAVSAGIDLALTSNLILSGGYRGQFAGSAKDQSVNLLLSLTF